MEHFDISKTGSGLFMPIDDNINQWTSLYNTRMHYRMLADQHRQQANKLKGDAMVKEIDKLLAFSANPMFDGSGDNKLINDTIGKYRDSIIDIKSRLLGGDMGALEEGANVLSQFSKDLDPNSNAIKAFGKQNYLVSQIQKIKDRVKDTNLYNLDAYREVDTTINELINKYNNNEINIDQLTQGINSIDDRNYRSLKQFIDEAEKISQDEWDSLSHDNMWKFNTKSINQNKAASLLLRAVNYAGGTDSDLFNFYKIVKGSKGEKNKEYLTQDEYNRLVQANKSATDDKQKIEVGADIKTDIRECTTKACRRVLGEVYPVMKGTTSTRSETEEQKAKLNVWQYGQQKNIDKEYKVWEEKINAKKSMIDVLKERMKNTNISSQQLNYLTIQLGIEEQKFQELLHGNKAITVEPVYVSHPFKKEDIENASNDPNFTTGNIVVDEFVQKHVQRTKLIVDINDKEGTVQAIINKIKKYNKAYFDHINVNGKGEEAIRLVTLKGLEELSKKGVKGLDGKVNYTQVLEAGYKADVDNLIYDEKQKKKFEELDKLLINSDAIITESPTHYWNNMGARLKRLDQDDLDKTLKRANALASTNSTENVSFSVLGNEASDAVIMNKMNTHGALFISKSTVAGDAPITLKDKNVVGITQYAVSSSGKPLFKVIYLDEKENPKSDIFMYMGKDAGLLVDGINSFERTTEQDLPRNPKINDYGNHANFTGEQNRVLGELDQGVKKIIKDRNKDKANNPYDYKDDDANKPYSFDVQYGYNTIKVTIFKDADGNLTNIYTASTVINGQNKKVKLNINMEKKEKNYLIYHNLFR